MKGRNIVITAIWAACLAFFGHLLLSALPLVAPSIDTVLVSNIVENNRIAIVSFFGFLGAAIGVLQHLGVKVTDTVSEMDVQPVPGDGTTDEATVQSDSSRLASLEEKASRLRSIAQANRHVAIKAMSYRILLLVGLQFGLCHIAAAGLQGVLQRAYPPADLAAGSLAFFVVAFAQTELLLLCALTVPFRLYRGFLRETNNSSQARSNSSLLRIGGLGIFAVGIVSLVTLSPEQISTLMGNEQLRQLPVLNVNYAVYLGTVRLIIFPIVGIVGAWVARASYSTRS